VKTLKLIIGILSCVLFMLIMFQSCSITVLSSVADPSDYSGAVGMIVAVLLLCAGITGIAGRNSRGGTIGAGVLYVLGGLFGFTGMATYPDLQIWSWICIVFGAVFLLSLAVPDNPPQPAAQPAPAYAPQYQPAPEVKAVETPAPAPAAEAPRPSLGAAVNLYPMRGYEASRPVMVSRCLRAAGVIVALANIAFGALFGYTSLLTAVVKHVDGPYQRLLALSIGFGVLIGAVAAFVCAVPFFGLAAAVEHLRAIALQTSGYVAADSE